MLMFSSELIHMDPPVLSNQQKCTYISTKSNLDDLICVLSNRDKCTKESTLSVSTKADNEDVSLSY